MGKIKLVLSVVCDDIETARKVQTEFLPSMDDLLVHPGVSEVSGEWLAEAESARGHLVPRTD